MWDDALKDLDHRRLERGIDRLERRLSPGVARRLHRLRHPSARWIRIPVGCLMIVGGLLSFLPVLGIWMLPLGLVLLAYDVPALKPLVGRTLIRGERYWRAWKRRRALRA
jgi:hypothetical protein